MKKKKKQNWRFGFYNCASYLIEQKWHEGFAPCLKLKVLIHHLNRMLAPERCGGRVGEGKGKTESRDRPLQTVAIRRFSRIFHCVLHDWSTVLWIL